MPERDVVIPGYAMRGNSQGVIPGRAEREPGIHNLRSRCEHGRCHSPHPTGLVVMDESPLLLARHTGSAMEYLTWLSAKLDSIEAMPSSRVSLFFRNAS
jgi:hypothetical protein